jgi:acyl-CoA thioesterase FadM
VNNIAYLKWAETSRCAYFSEVLQATLTGNNSVILVRLDFVYELPLGYREEVAIGCRVARMGRKSLELVNEIWSETRQQRAAHGVTYLVAYDYETKTSKPVPECWRQVINTYEPVAPL